MKKIRKIDYIVIFVVVFIGLLINIVDIPNQSLTPIIIKSLLIAVVFSLVFGTITNWLFKKR